MASLIPGFEYDIFISYRQKDNKYDGWVTEFVNNLKWELEATFKEEISVYFDNNPHDGLLETHDVDDSLKEKLKCLLFIPVISRTYCDPKSFAWEHEFKVFIEQASHDEFGLKIPLPNGNVASRVLPVRIHEPDICDIKLFEMVMGGALRGVDFIYRSAGVNRPLRASEDHPHDNLNRIYYRDQINKVANAVNEIIDGLKRTENSLVRENWSFAERSDQNNTDIHTDNERYITPAPRQHSNGNILKNIIEWTHKRRGFWPKNAYRYFFSILFIVLMLFLAFGRKEKFSFFGVGKSKRELAKSHVRAALTSISNKDYVSAKEELELALSIDNKYSYAWSSLAAVSVKEGNLNKAIGETIKAVSLDQNNSQAAYNMAYALDDKKDYNQAIKWYKTAIKIDSTLKKDSAIVPAYSALCRLYNTINQPIDAILILERVKNTYPKSKYIYLIYKNLGNAYLLQEQIDTSIKYLELSRNIKQDEAETNLYLAQAYEASGKITSSIEAWQNYIDLEVDSAKINEARRHLKEITIRHLKELIK
jgi:tetratricopeptide (TPR) repeat protein